MAFGKLYHEGKIGAEKDIGIAKEVKTAQTRSSHVSQCVSLLGDHALRINIDLCCDLKTNSKNGSKMGCGEYMSADSLRGQKMAEPLELQLQAIMRCSL